MRSCLELALSDCIGAAPEFPPLIDELAARWADFEAARRALLGAHAARCRVRVEAWYHTLVDQALDASDPDSEAACGALAQLVHLERHRLLATLGQALRRQHATLQAPGVAEPTPTSAIDVGAAGHLIALRTDAKTLPRQHASGETAPCP